MIGDNLSWRSLKRLKLSGSLVVLAFYLLCVIQSDKWIPYSVICAPLVATAWIWGLSHYKQPRQRGKIANFGFFPSGYRSITSITPRPPPALGFQRGSFITQEASFSDFDGLEVRRENPPPGGRSIQFEQSTTIKLGAKKDTLEPPARVSRYKKISDQKNWIV